MLGPTQLTIRKALACHWSSSSPRSTGNCNKATSALLSQVSVTTTIDFPVPSCFGQTCTACENSCRVELEYNCMLLQLDETFQVMIVLFLLHALAWYLFVFVVLWDKFEHKAYPMTWRCFSAPCTCLQCHHYSFKNMCSLQCGPSAVKLRYHCIMQQDCRKASLQGLIVRSD